MEVYSPLIHKAIDFAIKTHQLDQNQIRKGSKKTPYITHPLSVAIILAKTGARDEVIAAGILHDTIEDSTNEHRVTKETLEKEFGADVAKMVSDLTEDMELPWDVRKKGEVEALYKISNDSKLIRSADVLFNVADRIQTFRTEGPSMYDSFAVGFEKQKQRNINMIATLSEVWPENPLLPELKKCLEIIQKEWVG